MARIAGIDLPKDKRIEIGLTYIYGIGRKSAKDILAQTGVNPDTRVKDLTDADEQKLRDAIDSYTVEGDLRRQTALDIKRLTEIGCYRGIYVQDMGRILFGTVSLMVMAVLLDTLMSLVEKRLYRHQM